MDAVAESGRNPASKQIHSECKNKQADADGTAGPVSRDKFSGANEDRKKKTAQLDHEQDLQPYSADLFYTLLFH